MGIVRRKLMLVTFGTSGLKNIGKPWLLTYFIEVKIALNRTAIQPSIIFSIRLLVEINVNKIILQMVTIYYLQY